MSGRMSRCWAVLGLSAALVVSPGCGDDKVSKLVPLLSARGGSTVDPTGQAAYLVDFGNVVVGQPSTITFYIENQGRAVLNLQPLKPADPFTTDLERARSVGPQAATGVAFTFDPKTAQAFAQVVKVESDGGALALLLRGNGVLPAPTDCSFSVVNTLGVAITGVDFGLVAPLQSKDASFTIVNTGTTVCELKKLAAPNAPFGLPDGGIFSEQIAAGRSRQVRVRFSAPDEQGKSYQQGLEFQVGPPGKSVVLTLSAGTPTPPPEPPPPPAKATLVSYVNDSASLFGWNTAQNQLSTIGKFWVLGAGLGGGVGDDGMADIAIAPLASSAGLQGGELFGVSFHDLYRIDATSARCERLSSKSSDEFFNALTFLPDGRLIAAGGSGVWELDKATGAVKSTLVAPGGQYVSSGDIIALPDGHLYWTVRGASQSSPDRLVRIRTGDGGANPAIEVVVDDVGASDSAYGLAYEDDFPFGQLYVFSTDKSVRRYDVGSWTLEATTSLSSNAACTGDGCVFWGATTNPAKW
jgi:hypothetical protein